MNPVIVGRDTELLECLALVASSGPGVIVVGRPGVGKTRLIDELAIRADALGRRVVRIAGADASDDVPIKRTAASLWQAQRALVGPDPDHTLLCVDDAHLLDDFMLAALNQASRSTAATIAAATPPSGASHPAVVDLWKDGGLTRYELPPLTEAASAKLAEQLAPRQLTYEEVGEAWRLARGNPRDLVELVQGAAEAGQFAGTATAPLAPLRENQRLVRLIDERLAGLSPRARAAYEVLAVGKEAPHGPFEAHVGVNATLELETRNLITTDSDSHPARVRPSKTIDAEAVASQLDADRDDDACKVLLKCYADEPIRSRRDLIRRAEWQLKSGLQKDGGLLTDAAWAALLIDGPSRARALAAATHGPERDALLSEIGWLEGARTIVHQDAVARSGARSGPSNLEELGTELLRGIFGSVPQSAVAAAEAAEEVIASEPGAHAGPAAMALCASSWAWLAMGRMDEHIARLDRWRRDYAGIGAQIEGTRAGALVATESSDPTGPLSYALERLQTSDPLSQLPWILSGSVETHLRRGRKDEATEALRQLQRMTPIWPLLEAEQERAQAIYSLYTGLRSAGAQHLAQALDLTFPLRKPAFEVRLLEDRLRFGWADEADRGLRALVHDLGQPWPQLTALARFAAAGTIGDIRGLHSASVELLRGGWRLLAAEAAALASATAVARGGEVARAHGLATRSLLISSCFPDVRTPMLAARVLVTSEREAEMARLAAQGRSSREIADDYQLARRTVENHLASAYRKLDIHGRDDLREIYSGTLADLPADLIDGIADLAE